MTTYVDQSTGEVVDADVVASLANEYEALFAAIHEAATELALLTARRDAIQERLVNVLGENGHAAASTCDIVCVRGSSGKRSVDTTAALAHQEELMDLGLGRRVTEYRPPTLAALNRMKGEVIAAGIPWPQLVREPQQGSLTLQLVRKGQPHG